MENKRFYAHSKEGKPKEEWQLLEDHLGYWQIFLGSKMLLNITVTLTGLGAPPRARLA
jgi:hypothetical protein